MAKDFKIINEFKGYIHKTDETNVGDGFLVVGSKNVRFIDGERVGPRKGYELDGAANAALTPIESEFVFQTSRGVEIPLRSYDDELEYRILDSNGDPEWRRLADSFTSVAFNYTEFWDTSESLNLVLLVNGTSNIFSWSGGLTTFASATAATITKQGTTTWAEDGFLTSGTRSVVIDNISYAYTGGETTDTITGVVPDPTVAGHAVGAQIHQGLRTTANSAISGLGNAFANDLIATMQNQIWIASLTNQDVFVSKINDFTDFTFSSPRLPGEGALLRLNGAIVGFIVQEGTDTAEFMYVTAGIDQWYQSIFQLSADLTNEDLFIRVLKTNPLKAATNQAAIAKMKNNVVFLSNEPTLDTLGRIENIDTTQSTNLSDVIKVDFDDTDFTNANVIFFRDTLFIAAPADSVVYIYNIAKGFWEAPATLPISRFSIIGGELFGHSNSVPETYKLLTGNKDRIVGAAGNPINAVAAFSYQQFGRRAWQKNFDEWYTEGKISSNTIIDLQLNYEWTGAAGNPVYKIDGSDANLTFLVSEDGSFGKFSLGKAPLGGGGAAESLKKFRKKQPTVRLDFYEIQAIYSTNDVDQEWEILAFGPNSVVSKTDDASIKQS